MGQKVTRGKGVVRSGILRKDVDLDKEADRMRDQAISRLKEVIPTYPDKDPRKADLIFQLAELYYEKSKFIYFQEMKQYDEQYERYVKLRDAGEKVREPKLDTSRSRIFRDTAVRLYGQVLERYPDYPRRDEVLSQDSKVSSIILRNRSEEEN
jgi:hypothetical protein